MTVTRDVVTENLRTGTTSPQTFSHAAAASGVKGVVLAIVHGASSTDHVSAASYGGVALTRKQRNVDTATEPGAAELWFLGAGVPQGTQTVSYTPGATTDDIHAVCITLKGADDLEVIAVDGIDNNVANPSVTLNYAGRTCMAFAALYGGGADGGSFTPNANCTTLHDEDLGNFYSEVICQTTAGSADFAIGGTSSTDDVAFAAMAVTEVVAGFTATAASTLSALTVAGSGSLQFIGTSAITLPGAAVSGAGTHVQADDGYIITEDGDNLTTEGGDKLVTEGFIVPVSGTSAIALSSITVAGSGAMTFTGTGAIALASATVSGSGAQTFTGTSAVTLAATSVTGTAAQTFSATAALTLQAPTVAGAGALTFTGTGAVSLATLAVTGAGLETFSGTMASTLPGLTVAGTGLHPYLGTGAITLAAATVAGGGSQTFSGTGAATLQAPGVSGTGQLTFTGTAAISLASVQAGAAGVLAFNATSSIVLTPQQVAASGVLAFVATGAATLPGLTVAGAGTHINEFIGTSEITLAALVVAASGIADTDGAYNSVINARRRRDR